MKKIEEYVRSIPDFPPLSTERKWADRKGDELCGQSSNGTRI